jgi:hypothetical protein
MMRRRRSATCHRQALSLARDTSRSLSNVKVVLLRCSLGHNVVAPCAAIGLPVVTLGKVINPERPFPQDRRVTSHSS